ncbi:MAG: AbrB/MazE/SpoVT family DNA-binding domain-containing protein [Candidatus Nanopelagicales bacterium]|nr:AbrB/MazE/SpoVT family DNA-binding domain-containing protein [Candidatus Nanopelagicales bacterium]
MNGTYATVMGDRGRLVIPQELRARLHLDAGTPLAVVETPEALLLLTREQLKGLVRRDLAGASLVEQLLADRLREVAAEASSSPRS